MLIFKVFIILTVQLLSSDFYQKCPKEMDKALLEISIIINEPEEIIFENLEIFYQYKTCENCKKQLLLSQITDNGETVLLDSNYDYDFMVATKTMKICEDFEHEIFGECGYYKLGVYYYFNLKIIFNNLK